MMIIQLKGGAVKMKRNEYGPGCDACSELLEGLCDVVTVTIQKGIDARTQKFQFCDFDCFIRCVLRSADKKAVVRTVENFQRYGIW